MIRGRPSLLLLSSACVFSLLAHAQRKTPVAAAQATPDKRQILVKSGTLKLLSAREADLICGDASGGSVTLAFAVDQNTRHDASARGDAVNILYLANGTSKLALLIHRIAPSTNPAVRPNQIGGVARLEQPDPTFSISPQDAHSLQASLASKFGLSSTDGANARLTSVFLQNHSLAAATAENNAPWNIYLNGTLQTYSGVDPLPSPTQGAPYVLAPSDTLRVVRVSVSSHAVFLLLATQEAAAGHRVYSTLVIPITAGSAQGTNAVERQLGQILTTRPDLSAIKAIEYAQAGSELVRPSSSELTASLSNPATMAAATTAAAAPANTAAAAATVSLGQTKQEVIDLLGQPQKITTFGNREIYTYPYRTITFTNGRVSGIE